MKIRINHNDEQLYCIYSKESIEIGEKYIEIVEDYLGEEIIKTYKYWYLDIAIDEYLENYDTEPVIDVEDNVELD